MRISVGNKPVLRRILSRTMATTTVTTTTSTPYDELIGKLKTISQLQQVQSVLSYDRMVFMPKAPEAAAARGGQLSAMATVVHEKMTDKALFDLLEAAEKDLSTNNDEAKDEEETKKKKKNADVARMLELTRKSLEQTTRIPAELAARKAAHGAAANAAWAKAREAKDFSAFAPALEECFEIAKMEAKVKRENDSIGLYDQMLDDFETGMKESRIDEVFDEIEKALVPLLERVRNKSKKVPSTEPLKGTFPIEEQKKLCREIVTTMGYDDTHGRIDTAVHPFTSSASKADVRITSRFSDDEWAMGLIATIHEGGHAMYEQNLGESGLEIDKALSMGVHESQSLFWERHVAKSKSFWKWATPKLKETFPSFDYSPEEVYAAVNSVKADNMIRVEADELTYPLHVLLRYRLEKEIIADKIKVDAIPEKWNTLFKELLGTDVPDDAQGCLQDIHWSVFAIGYFPTYLLGSSAAAQLAYYCQKDIPDFYEQIEAGKFVEIKDWLKNKVHQHGKRYKSLDELFEAQLGEKLNPKYFIDYLEKKYSEIYDIA